MRRLVFLGPPGAGKGTQGKRLAKHLGVPFVSMGDLLRQKVQEKDPLSEELRTIMREGRYVPDEIVIRILAERLEGPDCQEGFILDGFPRTVAQANALDELLEQRGQALDGVILLEVPDEVVVERLAGRRICSACGEEFHVKYRPPKQEGVCDKCGGKLIQREDDQEATIRKRLQVYREQTAPLTEYARRKGLLHTVDGTGSMDQVFERLVGVLT